MFVTDDTHCAGQADGVYAESTPPANGKIGQAQSITYYICVSFQLIQYE